MEPQSAPQELVWGACGDGKTGKGIAGSALRRPTPARKSVGRTSGGGRLARLHCSLIRAPELTCYLGPLWRDVLASVELQRPVCAPRVGARRAKR